VSTRHLRRNTKYQDVSARANVRSPLMPPETGLRVSSPHRVSPLRDCAFGWPGEEPAQMVMASQRSAARMAATTAFGSSCWMLCPAPLTVTSSELDEKACQRCCASRHA
jgi:hypothetical protein